MATAAEIVGAKPREIPRLKVPFLSLSGENMQRLWPEDSLSYAFIRDKMSPNRLFSINTSEVKFMVIAPVGGYTPHGVHFMVMPWGDEYIPTPDKVPAQAFRAAMFINGNLASAMMDDPGTRFVVCGNNISPRSYGQKGYQSIPSWTHTMHFGLPDFSKQEIRDRHVEFVDEKTLDLPTRMSVKGGLHNVYFGRELVRFLQTEYGQGVPLRDFIDLDDAKLDRRGVRIPTIKPIDELLKSEVMVDGIQRVASHMDLLATHLSTTFTDFNPSAVDAIVKDTVKDCGMDVARRKQIYSDLCASPSLLPSKKRLENIGKMEGQYSEEFLDTLRRISQGLPEEGSVAEWKRGFGGMISVHYDKKEGVGFLAISGAVMDGPGGIVEATEGVLLRRPLDEAYTKDEVAAIKASYKNCIEAALYQNNGYHGFARVDKVFV